MGEEQKPFIESDRISVYDNISWPDISKYPEGSVSSFPLHGSTSAFPEIKRQIIGSNASPHNNDDISTMLFNVLVL